MWFAAALVISYAVLVVTGFLMRQKPWARTGLVWLTGLVLLIHLPLCWLLLGVDGLVRDGGPLLAASSLAMFGLWRSASKTGRTYQSKHIDSGEDGGEAGRPAHARDDVEDEEHGAGDGQQQRHQPGLGEHRGRLHET